MRPQLVAETGVIETRQSPERHLDRVSLLNCLQASRGVAFIRFPEASQGHRSEEMGRWPFDMLRLSAESALLQTGSCQLPTGRPRMGTYK